MNATSRGLGDVLRDGIVFLAYLSMLVAVPKAQAQTLGVSDTSFGSGNKVVVTGSGFPASVGVSVWYDQDPQGLLNHAIASVSATTGPTGAISTSIVVSGSPGSYFIHAGQNTTALVTTGVSIGTCWFQECTINGAVNICLLGNSPTDLQFVGTSLADCKPIDSNYTKPTSITTTHSPPGGYDMNNVGPTFLGAGVLAAATADLSLPGLPNAPGVPLTPCNAMAISIGKAEALGNSVPDKVSLLTIACAQFPFSGLGPYIGAVNLGGHAVPDAAFIQDAIGALKGTLLTAGVAATLVPSLAPGVTTTTADAALATSFTAVQQLLADAAVAGAVACGFVNYYCNGSDITYTILQNPDLQTRLIPFLFLQLDPPNPNPCAAAGFNNGNCWGDLIGWANVACTSQVAGTCEQPDSNGKYPFLPVPGSAGSPDNSGAPIKCTTGQVVGLSIGYDGDISFDVNGPEVVPLVNYHNFQPGPGGSDPPNGIDVESPVSDRPIFASTFAMLRPGMEVNVCGRWVADMHMLWNELHPLTSIRVLGNYVPASDWILAVSPMLDGED